MRTRSLCPLKHGLTTIAILLVLSSALAASTQPYSSSQTKADKLDFGGTVYLHRWSKNGQNEFTPESVSLAMIIVGLIGKRV